MESFVRRSFSIRAALVLCALLCTPLAAVTPAQAQSKKSLDAQFVKITYPSKVDAGKKVNVTVRMKNTGRSVWTTGYYLGSASSDNTSFSFPRVFVPKKTNPGSTVSFRFLGRAPSSSGYYTVQWKMHDASRKSFGKSTKTYDIRVRGNSSSSSSSYSSYGSGYGATDLAVTMSGPSTAEQNGIIRYTVTVRNNGPYDVHSVFPVQMAVIPSLTFRADQSSSGCYFNGSIAKCDISTLRAGEERAVTMAYNVNGTCNSQMQVQSFVGTIPQGETNWVNNASRDVFTTVTCTPQAQADLTADGSVQASTTDPQTFGYSLVVKNLGPSAVSDAQVRFGVPENLTLLTYTSNATCQKQGQLVTCSGFSLQNNETKTISVVIQIPTGALACDSFVTTRAIIASAVQDPNTNNNMGPAMSAQVKCPVAATANLFVTKDSTPVRSRQLLGGALGDPALRLNVRSQNAGVEVTHVQITGMSDNATTPATNPLRSVDRLQLFRPGDTTAFASATVAACANQSAPTGSMCADLPSGSFAIGANLEQQLIVRPLMKSDADGAVSGDAFILTIGTHASAIRAKHGTTGGALSANDGNGTAAGEVFIGTATPAANATITGNKNAVVMAKIANMMSINMTPNGTSLPTSFVEMARLRFVGATHANTLNGLNTVILKKVMFNVEVQNAEIDTSNLRANLYNTATQQFACRALNTQGQVITGMTQQSFFMECTAPSNVNGINQGTNSDMGVEVFVNQPKIAAANPVKVQISLQNYSDSALNGNFGVNGSHIEWIDTDTGTSKTYQWIEHSETALWGTLFN